MNEKALRQDLETFLEAVEQSLAVVAGIIANQTSAGTTLKHVLEGEQALQKQFGENGFRDRIFRRMAVQTALVARRQGSDDAALQSLIATVLTARTEDEPRSH